MIKSELVDKISLQNLHLYRRDAEKIVNAILSEIAAALAAVTGLNCEGLGFSL